MIITATLVSWHRCIIQDMQSRMPSDPFEAELLMMAEAVASGGRESDSESEVSDDDNCKTLGVSIVTW